MPCRFLFITKKEGIYNRLIRENKIAQIACRVAASSNKALYVATFSLRSKFADELEERCDGSKAKIGSATFLLYNVYIDTGGI